MNAAARQLSRRYAAALHRYQTREEEAQLQRAYDLGRNAVAQGVGLLEMARIHEQALTRSLSRTTSPTASAKVQRLAETFFFEVLSSFEVTHRGFREGNARLQQLIETLEHRNQELAGEVGERQRTENALRESEGSLRELSHQMLHLQEEERTRISRELHDEVGQALTAINMNLAMLAKLNTAPTRRFKKTVADSRRLLVQTMETVHNFARELRPVMLDDLGLIPALRSYARNFASRTGIRLRFRANPAAERLDRDCKTVLFRVTQESLTNVVRHARATRVEVTIELHRRHIRLTVKDNGRAFRLDQNGAPKTGKRLGLLGMQERVRLVNGQFQIASKPGNGTTVRVELPFRTSATKRV